jgi:solute carrier family 25 iron transporter 28/37
MSTSPDRPFTNGELAVAGALSRALGQAVLHPADTIKTRLEFQEKKRVPKVSATLSTSGAGANSSATVDATTRTTVRDRIPQYRGIRHAAVSMIQTEGVTSLYRGLGTRLFYVMPAAACNYIMYERVAQALRSNSTGSSGSGDGGISKSSALLPAAGLLAGRIFGSFVRTPFDVVKQVAQVHPSVFKEATAATAKEQRASTSSISIVSRIIKTTGIRRVFGLTHVSLMRDVPFMVAYFSTYEWGRARIAEYYSRSSASEQPAWTHIVAGAFSGATACLATAPMDVVKTRMQLDAFLPPSQQKYTSISDCFRQIVRSEGWRGLYVGTGARLAHVTPMAAVIWTSYETIKSWIARMRPPETV